jgi:phospholipid/cholesterol/gamma-HCH transport system substrate-binding protein
VVIVLAAILTATLGLLLAGGGGDLLAPRTTITTYMPDGTELASYSIVRVGGIPIGKVSNVRISGSFDPQRAVRVEMRVVTRFLKNIPIDSQTNIGKDTLVGYPFIDIDPGKSRTTLPENGELQSEPLPAAVVRADQIRALQQTFQGIDDLLATVTAPTGSIGEFIYGAAEYDRVLQDVTDFDRGVTALVTPRSAAGQAVYSMRLYDAINGRVHSVDQMLESIQSGNGAAGRIFAEPDLYDNLLRTVMDLRKTLADLNSSQFIADDQTYLRITKMLASVDTTLASILAGEGRTGELLLSPQLYESLTGELRQIQLLLTDLRGNPKKFLRYKVF